MACHVLAGPGPAARAGSTAAGLVNDAQLAAIAIRHRAEVVSYDGDFARFSELRWHRPDDPLG